MNALLDLHAIRQRVTRLSVEDYHRLGEMPVELLRGVVVDRKAKPPLHCYLIFGLRQVIEPQIAPNLVLRQYGPLTFVDSELEPDLAVVSGSPQDYRAAHPDTAELVIEIAVSSLEIDRAKALIYAEAGVKEYWIVCPEEKRVELYRQPAADGYADRLIVSAPETIVSTALPGVSVDLAAFFA